MLHCMLHRRRALLLSTVLCASLACGPKMIRYDTGAFAIVIPKTLIVEHFVSSQQSVFSLRLGHDGPVCATLQFTHQGGGACGPEELALQKGLDPHCDETLDNCSACVDLDGTAAQLHARTLDELECSEVVRGIFASLKVKPALHK